MFPENSGVYIAKRDNEMYVVKVKGVYPTLQLDKRALDLGGFLYKGKAQDVTQDVLDNIELFHSSWEFIPLSFVGFNVFSEIDYALDGKQLYLSEEDILSIRGKYYRMCQQGVSVTKVIRALGYEFKVSKEQIISLINSFDKQATRYVNS